MFEKIKVNWTEIEHVNTHFSYIHMFLVGYLLCIMIISSKFPELLLCLHDDSV